MRRNKLLLDTAFRLHYNERKREVISMTQNYVLKELREKNGLSQDELAEKLFVTRQAVSRWENGNTLPNPETLKALSKLYGVTINTLLGSKENLFCQCCGMPLDDGVTSRETDGTFNELYCKWCYADGRFAYSSIDELTYFLVSNFAADQPVEQARRVFREQLSSLKHWRKN